MTAVVETTVARNRLIVLALVSGVVVLAGLAGFIEFEPIPVAASASLPLGLAGLISLVIGWRVYAAMSQPAEGAEVEDHLARYSVALIASLAITEGVAFLGVVCYMLGGEIVAMTGVVAHVMLTGVLWPTAEKAWPSR